MNEVMEQVAKSGDDVSSFGRVVIRPEDGRELVIGVERGADPSKCVSMRKDVRVHEDEHVPLGSAGAVVTRGSRAGAFLDDDQLLGRLVRLTDAPFAASQGLGAVGRRDDRAEGGAADATFYTAGWRGVPDGGSTRTGEARSCGLP